MDLGREKGESHWLTVLPLSEHMFKLHKGAFRDAVSLHYRWNIPYLSPNVSVGKCSSLSMLLTANWFHNPQMQSHQG